MTCNIPVDEHTKGIYQNLFVTEYSTDNILKQEYCASVHVTVLAVIDSEMFPLHFGGNKTMQLTACGVHWME